MLITLALLFAQILPITQNSPPFAVSDPGDLDPTFGTDGYVITDTSPLFGANIINLENGDILVGQSGWPAGSTTVTFYFAKYDEEGTLVESFGEGGVMEDVVDFVGGPMVAAVQDDGKFVAGLFDQVTNSVLLRRYHDSGEVDGTFGTGGSLFVTASFESAQFNGIAVQPDEKILVLGRCLCSERLKIYRFLPDGTLDVTFGDSGVTQVNLEGVPGTQDHYNAIDVATDGKIMVLGGFYDDDAALAVRFTDDGGLDTSFNGTGVVTTSFFDLGGDGSYDYISSFLQSDGKVVVGGIQRSATGAFGCILARYNTDGSLDASFGTNGRIFFPTGAPMGPVADRVEVDQNQRLLLSGLGNLFTLRRYEVDGELDGSFGSDGEVTTHGGVVSEEFGAAALVLQSGSLLVSIYTEARPGIIAFTSDGTLDESFGVNGLAWIDLLSNSYLGYMVRRDTGAIVVAGRRSSGNGGYMTLAQVLPNGEMDQSFGDGGVVIVDLEMNEYNYVGGLELDDEGRLLLVGYAEVNDRGAIVLMRFNSDGSLDPTFGADGMVFTSRSDGFYSPEGLEVDSQGRIVVGGVTGIGTIEDWMAARYYGDGSLDPSFGNSGVIIEDFGTNTVWLAGINVDANDGVLLAGTINTPTSLDLGVARLDESGMVDLSFGNDGLALAGFTGTDNIARSFFSHLDGTLLVGGSTEHLGGCPIQTPVCPGNILTAVFEEDGQLDEDWGDGGRAVTDLGGSEDLRSLIVQSDGEVSKPVVVGSFIPERNGEYSGDDRDLLLVRFESHLPVGIHDSVQEPRFQMAPSAPNPFSASTSFNLQVSESTHASLKVYDVLGREVARLIDGELSAGEHTVRWAPLGLSTGVYLFRLETSHGIAQRAVTYIR